MKKILVIIVVALLSLSALFAADELMMFAMSNGYNKANGGFEIGFYTQYQLGIEVNSKFSIGGGAYLSSDFLVWNKEASNATSASIGPAFSLSLNKNFILASVFGFESMLISKENSDDVAYGYGFGGTFSLNFIPQSEKNNRMQTGFTLGTNLSLTYLEKNSSPSFSIRAFFGFTFSQPFFPRTYPRELYDKILDTYFYPY